VKYGFFYQIKRHLKLTFHNFRLRQKPTILSPDFYPYTVNVSLSACLFAKSGFWNFNGGHEVKL